MLFKQYFALAVGVSFALLAAGCASSPNAANEQAASQPAPAQPCYRRTGSNLCQRDPG